MRVWYFVTGKLDGDDETSKLLQAVDYDDAVARFERSLHGGDIAVFTNYVVRCGDTKPVIEATPE